MRTMKGVPSVGMVRPHVCADQRDVTPLNKLTLEDAIYRYDYIVRQVSANYIAVYPGIAKEDLQQEGILAIIETFQSTDLSAGHNRFSALITDAVNRRIRAFCEHDYISSKVSMVPNNTECIEAFILRDDVQCMLNSLPERYQRVLRMYWMEELKIKEIAERLETSVYYADKLLRRAIVKARRACIMRHLCSAYDDLEGYIDGYRNQYGV